MKIPVTPPSDGSSPSPSVLLEEARIWLSRLAGAEVTQMDVQAFKRWQRLSPAHEAAFEETKRQWRTMKPVLGELLRGDPALAARHARLMRGPDLKRRRWLGAAAGAVAAAGVAAVYPPLGLWPAAAEWNADFRTATGEQRSVLLADNVRLTLNTQTSIRRHTVGDRTAGVDLIAGEAAVDLQPAAVSSVASSALASPAAFSAAPAFSVIAGKGRSVAASGRFEVRYVEGKVCVTCMEGALRVEHPAGQRDLRAGQQTVYDADTLGNVAAVELDEVSAWRKGELVFRQTPLVHVVEEINRYRPGRVVLMAEVRDDNAISGRFPIHLLNEALLQIQQTFDLHARSLPGGILILT